MTPSDWRYFAGVVVAATTWTAIVAWWIRKEIALLRRDVLHAGIDCHHQLLEIAMHLRNQQLRGLPPRAAESVTDGGTETPEQWLERIRKQTEERARRGDPRPV